MGCVTFYFVIPAGIVVGVDPRFACSVHVFGCGHLDQGSCWLETFQKMGPERAQKWVRLWDPSSRTLYHRWRDGERDSVQLLGAYAFLQGLLPWVVTHLESVDRDGQRLADAVAVAGVRAAGGGSPRVVVLLVEGTPEDASGQQPEAVRRYLELLRVPLRVWSTDGTEREVAGWGSAEDVSSRRKLRRAAERIEELLARQWIVWVQGRHLPASLQLDGDPEGIRLLK